MAGGGGVLKPVSNSNSVQSVNNLYVSGNVGIGTTGPVAPLHIVGGQLLKQASGNNQIALDFDPNAKIEIKGGTPYIDFATDPAVDFQSRIQQTNNNTLTISSTNVNINGTITNNGTSLNMANQSPFYGIVGQGIISYGFIYPSVISGAIATFETRISYSRVAALLYLSGAITFRTNTSSGTIGFAKSNLNFNGYSVFPYVLVSGTGIYTGCTSSEDTHNIYITYSNAATGSENTNYTMFKVLIGLSENNGY